MKNIPDYKILEKMIDSGTHLNLSHVNHNFVELEVYDKLKIQRHDLQRTLKINYLISTLKAEPNYYLDIT